MEFFREIQSMGSLKIETIDLVEREVLRNLKSEREDHSLVDSVEGEDCSNLQEPQKLSTADDQFTETYCPRNEDESKNVKEEDASLQIKGDELTENLNDTVDGEVEVIQLSAETAAIVDFNEEEEDCNDSKIKENEESGRNQKLCDFDVVVKRMEEEVSEVEDDNFKISEKEEAGNGVTNSDSGVEESASRTETQDSDLVDKEMNGESKDCNFMKTNDASEGTANNLEENENEQLLEKTRKRKTDESEDFNENLKMKKVEFTEIEIRPNSIAETASNLQLFTREGSKTFEKEESEFNEETQSCDNIHHCVGIVNPEAKTSEEKSTSTEAMKADTEEGEDSRNLKDEERSIIINEKAVESIFIKQETFEKLQKWDHLQENEEDNNNCKIHNVIVGEQATKIDTSAIFCDIEKLVTFVVDEESRDTNNTEKDEGEKENHKRKCDDLEEAEPSAKIAKTEPKPVEPEPELVEPEPELVEPEPELVEPEPEPENPDETAKKSEVNTDLIQRIFQNPMTSAWESKLHKPYELHTLGSDTEEYRTVKAKFDATSANRLTAQEIKRVENPYLLGIYLLKKDKLERNRSVQERCLFHGTRESSVDGICRFNFDWRRKGQSRGHKFGQGVSFSPKSSYSRHYGSGRVMFLAKVLVSQAVEGTCTTVIPPEPYDSTRNYSGDVIVKYSDDDFYPQYIIYYS